MGNEQVPQDDTFRFDWIEKNLYNGSTTTCVLDTGSDAIVFPEQVRRAILNEFFPSVIPQDGGREFVDCDLWVGVANYRSVRLYMHDGNYIDWDVKHFVRYDPYYRQCYLLIAQGATDEECDLSSNFLRAAYSECLVAQCRY
jgi:hypothetical protein